MQVEDFGGKAFANTKYKLTIGEKIVEGTTGDDGKIEQEILADAKSGELFLFSKAGGKEVIGVIPLEFGILEPVEDDSGVQARSSNLGFDCGDVNGTLGTETKVATKAFQSKNGLVTSDDADAATRAKLKKIHDWE